ncbi:MAG TPA: hypothetical protein VE219_04045, partial [Candidatus Sulfotelmatobacter sp.]|nr:hypothetical protein [Candidatus Sulfotelmatobacter sp.]
KALNRRVGALEDIAGAVFEPQLNQKVPGLLAKSRLRVQPLTREELALYLQSSGASDEHMAALVDQPDFLGIATGEGGSALVIAEASLMADDHDVERLESWRYVAQQYGIPVILVLVARRRGRFLPSRDELASRGIAWSISNERDRRVPERQLGKFDPRPS